jgi:hypothetical protein
MREKTNARLHQNQRGTVTKVGHCIKEMPEKGGLEVEESGANSPHFAIFRGATSPFIKSEEHSDAARSTTNTSRKLPSTTKPLWTP